MDTGRVREDRLLARLLTLLVCCPTGPGTFIVTRSLRGEEVVPPTLWQRNGSGWSAPELIVKPGWAGSAWAGGAFALGAKAQRSIARRGAECAGRKIEQRRHAVLGRCPCSGGAGRPVR